jgi:hypothetical protein
MNVCCLERLLKSLNKKVKIFEYNKQAHAIKQTDAEINFLCFLSFAFRDSNTKKINDAGRYNQEKQKTPVPPGVEHITRHQNKQVLQTQILIEYKPV